MNSTNDLPQTDRDYEHAGTDLPSSDRTTQADDVLARVVQGAHDTIDRLAETAAPHVHRLQEGMGSTNELLHSRADQAREMSEEWAENLRCTVRENPLAAVATALAVGVLVARLTR